MAPQGAGPAVQIRDDVVRMADGSAPAEGAGYCWPRARLAPLHAEGRGTQFWRLTGIGFGKKPARLPRLPRTNAADSVFWGSNLKSGRLSAALLRPPFARLGARP